MKHFLTYFLVLTLPIAAQKKVSERTAMTGAQIDGAADWIGISDMSAANSKKISPNELWNYFKASASFSGTTTVASLYATDVSTGSFAATGSVTVPNASFTLNKLAQSGATSGQVAAWNGTAWAPATASGGSFASLTGNPSDNAAMASALGLKVSSSEVSIIGGIDKILKVASLTKPVGGPVPYLNLSGLSLTQAPYSASGDTGGIAIGELSSYAMVKPDGTKMGRLYPWFGHDSQGGEVILESNHRIAFAPGPHGAMQIGLSYDTTATQFAYMQARYTPTVGVPLGESDPLFFNAATYGISTGSITHVGLQGRATASGNNELILFAGSTFPDGTGVDGTMPEIGAVTVDGIRDPKGNSPPFVSLADGTISLGCSTAKGFQNHVVTLAENSTLSITGATAGMRGTIFVIQDGIGSRTLTLPSNSATQSGFAISTAAGKIDRLDWVYDGAYFYFEGSLAWNLPLDSDAGAFLTAASISSGSAEGIAVNNLVLTLKGGENLWANKIVEMWPLVGGNSTAHAQGLKGVQDATFGAGVTHNSSGITGNASATGWMNSGINISALGLRDDIGVYFYNKEATTTAGGRIFGCSGTNARFYATESAGVLYGSGFCSADINTVAVTQSPDDRGHYWFGRTSSTSITARFNATSQTATNAANTAPTDAPFFLGMNSGSGTATNGTNAILGFAAVTKGLTADQYNALKAAVDAFQAALGRANP